MCAFFGPKNGDFQKMLRIVWNGEKCNKILKKLFLGSIVYWYWIVSFLVLNILGIVNKNNPIMLRSLSTKKIYHKMFSSSSVCVFKWVKYEVWNWLKKLLVVYILIFRWCTQYLHTRSKINNWPNKLGQSTMDDF